MTYAAGAQLGALRVADPAWIGFTALACSWGLIFPALVALAQTDKLKSQVGAP